jgi:hypothetical protein
LEHTRGDRRWWERSGWLLVPEGEELRVVGAAVLSREPGIDQGHCDDVYMLRDAVVEIYYVGCVGMDRVTTCEHESSS